ncbi:MULTISPECIES: BON domain-containing protein [Ramlibacter]|uniref:BON domain-containing protein n=1 Tax=Ramlibacter aquaticus TaxID=2780094 RepID=A0ABR9SH00_9BURK|nr:MULTISPECIES: BON domain-containing protein [Ramlibacter]MBE7941631.1 BON domain-containing protein [Ramlibacter aquaticus]
MKSKIAPALVIAASLLAPFAASAADSAGSDTDRTQPKVFVKDSVITTKIKAQLAEEKLGSLARVRVDTHGRGAVVLSGKVRSQAEADRAISIAHATEGVSSVHSRMRIQKDD